MDGLEIRQAQRSDAGRIRDLTLEAYQPWVPILGREPRPMQADFEEAVRLHRFDLAFLDHELAGLIETVDEPDQLLIENIAIRPQFQGKGLGRRLLTHAEELAQAAGKDRIRLFTNKLMARNVRIYQAFGYGIDREEPFPDAVAVHMSKALATRTGS